MKLLGSTKQDVGKDKNGEVAPKLELVEVVQCIVIQSKIIINTHQKFYLVLSQKTIWIVYKYFTTFFNDDEYS